MTKDNTNKSLESIEEQNSTKIVRALVKLSSSFNNIDYMNDPENKMFRFKMKQDLIRYEEWANKYTGKVITAMFSHKEELIMELIGWFNDFDSNFHMDDEFERQTFLWMIKTQSVLYDLRQVKSPHHMKVFAENIVKRIEPIFKQGYMSILLTGTMNPEYQKALDIMNALGENIMANEEN